MSSNPVNFISEMRILRQKVVFFRLPRIGVFWIFVVSVRPHVCFPLIEFHLCPNFFRLLSRKMARFASSFLLGPTTSPGQKILLSIIRYLLSNFQKATFSMWRRCSCGQGNLIFRSRFLKLQMADWKTVVIFKISDWYHVEAMHRVQVTSRLQIYVNHWFCCFLEYRFFLSQLLCNCSFFNASFFSNFTILRIVMCRSSQNHRNQNRCAFMKRMSVYQVGKERLTHIGSLQIM